MYDIDDLVNAIEHVADALTEPDLEPNSARTDWRDVEQQITALADLAKARLVAPIDGVLADLEDPEEAGDLALGVGYLLGELGVLMQASSLHDGNSMLQDARRIGAGDPELDASSAEPGSFAKLVRARWRLKTGDVHGATRLFKKLRAATSNKVFRDAAQEGIDTPRPMRGTPLLFSLNGFGISLYGHRDPRPDGTHIKTTYITALFVPLLPLRSYRVHDHGDDSVTFYARERLNTTSKVWQGAVALAIVGTIAGAWLSSHFDSDKYKARRAYEKAQKLERAGKKEAARKAYEKLLADYAPQADGSVVEGAAKRLVKIYASRVKKPVTSARLSQVELVVQHFMKLPQRAREGAAAGALTRTLEGWVDAMGKRTHRDAEAGLAVLALAEQVARDDDLRRVRNRRRDWLVARADQVAAKWPARALSTYVLYPRHNVARAGAARVLGVMAAHPALLLSEQKLVRAWLGTDGARGKHAALAKRVRIGLKAARALAQNKDRRALLAKPDEKKLAAYLQANPTDQQAAIALARLQRQRGANKAAQATLTQLGPTGILVPNARLTLASLYSDVGQLDRAAKLLEAHLAGRLGRFRKAQRAYQTAAESLRSRLVVKAQTGNLPPDLSDRLKRLTDDDQRKAFNEWMAKQFRTDEQLKGLRAEYESFSTVVPACLTLGMVKLRQARAARGGQRQGLLADAERLFLAIRAEATGVASYHLSLGQVYYRLGKKAQGEKELQSLLAQSKPLLHIEVAKAYRQLGMVQRARQVGTKVWEKHRNNKEFSTAAATLMGVMADNLDDEERWLKRADPTREHVQTRLLEVQARRMMEQGKWRKADALFAMAEKANAKTATHSSASANNAAIACQSRYYCTGDSRHLARGLKYLEAARRLRPDNTVVVSNLASSARYVGVIDVLSKIFPVHSLRLGSSEAWSVLSEVSGGSLRKRIIGAVQTNARVRRSLELTQQEEVLAPERLGGYHRELSLYRLLRNAGQLRKLKARLDQLPKLQTAEAAQSAKEFRAGKHDKRLLKQYDRVVLQRQKLVASNARKAKPTHAVALFLLGGAYYSRGRLKHSLDDIRRALVAYRKAQRTWPELDLQGSLLWGQVYLAVLEVARKIPALQKRWKRESRVYTIPMFLHRLLLDAKCGAMVTALAARPELRQLLTARAERIKKRPYLGEWVLARVLKDQALIALTSAVFRRPEARLIEEIEARLSPWDKEEQLEWQLYKQHK